MTKDAEQGVLLVRYLFLEQRPRTRLDQLRGSKTNFQLLLLRRRRQLDRRVPSLRHR